MKHVKWLLLLVLLASLALGLAACGGDKEPTSPPAAEATQISETEPTEQAQAEAPTPAPESAEPTDATVPEPTESVEEVLDSSTLASGTDLSSYKSTMVITTVIDEAGQEKTQTIEFYTEYTRDPEAQYIKMSGEALDAESQGEDIEMYQVAGAMYMKMGDQWMSVPADEGGIDADAMVTPDAMLDDLCGWKKEGKEEINGVDVVHWSFTKEDFDKCAVLEDITGLGTLTDAGGDLYVAEDDNYVALMDLYYEGEDLELGIGQADEGAKATRMEIHYEMSDVNEPFTIEVPAEALEAGALPGDIPLPDDAAEVGNMFGMITFTSAQAPDAVFEFYKEAMPNNGWTEVSAEAMTGLWMMEYSKEGRTASIMISEDDGGQASVMITVTEPE